MPMIAPEKFAKDWQCAARKQGTAGGNDPVDCDWPFCGCDPYADRVMDVIEESGFKIVKSGALKLTTFEEIYFGGIRLDPGTYEVRRVGDQRFLPEQTF